MPHTIISSPSFPLIAGILSKMMTLPFGRSRWVSKYFVLLDSELRFYKDEHAESILQTLNLRQVLKVTPASTLNHPYCIRLEPKKDISMRPWMIDCKSQKDMDFWVSSIQSRLDKYNSETAECSSVKSVIVVSPDLYRDPVLPLRCTNQYKPLLSRRNKSLAPIITARQDITFSPISSPVTPSPTGAILGHNSKSKTINDYPILASSVMDQYSIKKNTSGPPASSSPTFLMYKKRFHI